MLKQTSDSGKIKIGVQCGDCIHFKRGPAAFEDVCIKLGIEKEDKVCGKFSPDLFVINKIDVSNLSELGRITKEMPPKALRILAYTFRHIATIKGMGFNFGQPVFLSIGGDYLNHYFKGYVIGVDRRDDRVYIASSIRNVKTNAFMSVYSNTLLTLAEWRVKKESLIEKDKIVQYIKPPVGKPRWRMPLAELMDKNGKFKKKDLRPPALADYTPPTIDTVPEEWRDSRKPISFKAQELLEKKLEKEKKKKIKNNAYLKINKGKRGTVVSIR